MDAKVTQIGDNGEGNLRRKLVDIVDALDREIDLTWALIGLVETIVARLAAMITTVPACWRLQTVWSMVCQPFGK
jgi:hypothetical protein